MNLTIEVGLIITILLVFMRLSALFLLTPLFSLAKVPVRIRLFFFLGLAMILVMAFPGPATPVFTTTSSIFIAMAYELFIGSLMAFGLFAAFGAFLLGGRIVDVQMGFGVANLIDPATNSQAPMLGTLLNLIAVAIFFLIDGHHLLIRGIAYSLQAVPPGSGLQNFNVGPLVTQFGLMFIYGLMLVAPVVFTLLLLDVGLAVAARTMPQLNMFIVSLPLKILVGLIVLTVSLNFMKPLLVKIYTSIFTYWQAVLV